MPRGRRHVAALRSIAVIAGTVVVQLAGCPWRQILSDDLHTGGRASLRLAIELGGQGLGD